ALDLAGERGPGRHPELGDGPGDREAAAVDRRHMLGGAVDEEDGHAGADEMGAHGAADGARAPDQDRRPVWHAAPHQPDSMTPRVSSTATAQSACISSSLRS